MADEVLGHIDLLIKKRPMYKEALSVYRDLIGFLDELESEITYEIRDETVREIKVKEGFPVFSREDLPLDRSAIMLLFQELLEHLTLHKRKDKEALTKALTKVHGDSKWVHDVITVFLSRDEAALASMAEGVRLTPIVLKFLAHMAMKPSLKSLRESVRERIHKDGWNYGYCPVCGSSPDMAYFDSEGKRFLHCELCGCEWSFHRLTCPFCENRKSKDLGYFTSDEDEGYRVDFCKQCGRYIKTLDMRAIESPAPLEIENLITLHLDILAQQQGFKAHSS
jgi:FdhE protein